MYPIFSLLQILIRNRATDLDARMYDGSTALSLAARLAVEGMVEELITCHADVNAVDEIGKCNKGKRIEFLLLVEGCIVSDGSILFSQESQLCTGQQQLTMLKLQLPC